MKTSISQSSIPDASCFSLLKAHGILVEACRSVGLSSQGAELIRLGENAVYRLRNEPVVVRIARSLDRLPIAEKTILAARWLHSVGIAVVLPLPDLTQPAVIDEQVVTYWTAIPTAPIPTFTDLAPILNKLHSLQPPESLSLPPWDPFAPITKRLNQAQGVDQESLDFLHFRTVDLQRQYSDHCFASASTVIHGNPDVTNLLRSPEGQILLIDLDNLAIGIPEYDLAEIGVNYHSMGWCSESDYRGFSTTYGRDILKSPDFPLLSGILELERVTWLMQNVTTSRATAREFKWRVQTLREEIIPRHWHVF
ncbi:MAG: phosphotransferase [Candidatus Dormibacteraceae bacterium]